jgi:hypothetical protein
MKEEIRLAQEHLFRAHGKLYRLWLYSSGGEKEAIAGICSTLNNLLQSLEQLRTSRIFSFPEEEEGK